MTKRDIAQAAVTLLEPTEAQEKAFDPVRFFERCLELGAAGSTLFVLDNFETVESTADVFQWIDAHVRPPNKILITTRFRDFVGDYHIDVHGMTEEEAERLIDKEAARLGVEALMSIQYREQLIAESYGHPYVIKILLGEAARTRTAHKPERIVAGQENVLRALFERTFANLSPGAQRQFLLLSSWRVLVPEVALEAVALRPENEKMDVQGALNELKRFSLVEEVVSDSDGSLFVGLPLAAALYGRRKLEVSPYKVAIESDRKLLMEFGAGRREDAHRGVFPRIERLVSAIADRASAGNERVADTLPILEYLASRVPQTYLRLVDLVLRDDSVDGREEKAKTYLLSLLEADQPALRKTAWSQLADLSRATGDVVGEVHALVEQTQLPTATIDELSNAANRVNTRLYDLKKDRTDSAWSREVMLLVEKLVESLERRRRELSATDCSRLAWLQANVGNQERAIATARFGLSLEPDNPYCQRLLQKLEP